MLDGALDAYREAQKYDPVVIAEEFADLASLLNPSKDIQSPQKSDLGPEGPGLSLDF